MPLCLYLIKLEEMHEVFKMTQTIGHALGMADRPGFFQATVGSCSTATLLVFALLAGCATPNTAQTDTAQTASPAVPSATCTADSDAFCVEGKEDAAARLNRRGIEQAQVQNFDQALDLFKQAIEMDPLNPESHYNLGVVYNSKQMPVETEAAYMAGLAIQSSNPQRTQFFAMIHFNLACLYALQGKKDAAFEQLEKMFVVDKKLLFHWVEADADLNSLRADPRFIEILARRSVEDSSPPEEASKIKESGKPN